MMNQPLSKKNQTYTQTLSIHPAQVLAHVKRDDVKANIRELWCAPYDADPILEPDFVGLTHGQVILLQQMRLAARGEGGAVDRVLDRLIGKPEQVNKNLNVQGTYKDFLEEVARKEGIIDVDARTTDQDQSEI